MSTKIQWMDTSHVSPHKITHKIQEQLENPSTATVLAPYNGSETEKSNYRLLENFPNYSYLHAENPHSSPALIITTSGSTGQAKKTLISQENLASSARATEEYFGASGQWLCVLPLHYIAGIQTLYRSLRSKFQPVLCNFLETGENFSVSDFLYSAQKLESTHTFTSLVPAQLAKLLDVSQKEPEVLDALKNFTGILVGGAPLSTELQETLETAGIDTITRTYGMTESCGGTVYNGSALNQTCLSISELSEEIYLGGPMIANGYLEEDPQSPLTRAAFFNSTEPPVPQSSATRFFKTHDIGKISDQRLTVHGRSDDVIITGGLKVSAVFIQDVLERLEEVSESFVSSVDDSYWGQKIVALVVPSQKFKNQPSDLRYILKESSILAKHEIPKNILIVKNLPSTSTGKINRPAAKDLLVRLLETNLEN